MRERSSEWCHSRSGQLELGRPMNNEWLSLDRRWGNWMARRKILCIFWSNYGTVCNASECHLCFSNNEMMPCEFLSVFISVLLHCVVFAQLDNSLWLSLQSLLYTCWRSSSWIALELATILLLHLFFVLLYSCICMGVMLFIRLYLSFGVLLKQSFFQCTWAVFVQSVVAVYTMSTPWCCTVHVATWRNTALCLVDLFSNSARMLCDALWW